MRRLPREQWRLRREADCVLVAADERNGAYWWTRFDLADMPNDLVGSDDLKLIEIDVIDGRAIVTGEGEFADA